MSEFMDVWNQLPFITRHVTALASLEFLLLHFFPSSFLQLWLLARLPVTKPWTLATSAFSVFREKPMQAVMSLCFLWINMRSIEESSRMNRGDLVFFIVFVQIGCVIVGPALGIYAFLGIHTAAITYYCSQESPRSDVLMFGVVKVLHGLLPWANTALALVVGGLGATFEPLLGIFLGHLYLFLTELLPGAGGPKLETPELINQWVHGQQMAHAPAAPKTKQPASDTKANASEQFSGKSTGLNTDRFGGQGHKLGK